MRKPSPASQYRSLCKYKYAANGNDATRTQPHPTATTFSASGRSKWRKRSRPLRACLLRPTLPPRQRSCWQICASKPCVPLNRELTKRRQRLQQQGGTDRSITRVSQGCGLVTVPTTHDDVLYAYVILSIFTTLSCKFAEPHLQSASLINAPQPCTLSTLRFLRPKSTPHHRASAR